MQPQNNNPAFTRSQSEIIPPAQILSARSLFPIDQNELDQASADVEEQNARYAATAAEALKNYERKDF